MATAAILTTTTLYNQLDECGVLPKTIEAINGRDSVHLWGRRDWVVSRSPAYTAVVEFGHQNKGKCEGENKGRKNQGQIRDLGDRLLTMVSVDDDDKLLNNGEA
ncbi:hypothetical protein RND81_05G022200 [Saponaria officinalis]|uniref:Uncharacterized protein n=1 Tax=Saponaria officinalis TaxID=3572 RepID=A0AAW1KSJ7_SAPOF